MSRVYVYTAYERMWHWLQAISILLLSFTGFEIHAPERLHLFGFALATRLHETLALVTVGNAILALFYHLTTGAIRKFVPARGDIFNLAYQQVSYYLFGIFRNEPHPLARGPSARLNVLQQLTYLAILNLLLPVQILSGVVLWQAHRLERVLSEVGGLRTVAAIHVGAAWLFVSFLILHVYLTTTGPTPTAHLKSMISGHEEQPVER